MNKIIFIITVLTLVFCTSCKKDRTCTCTYTTKGATLKETITYHNISNKNAQENCKNQPITIITDNDSETLSMSCYLD
jgi:hypothetical protein